MVASATRSPPRKMWFLNTCTKEGAARHWSPPPELPVCVPSVGDSPVPAISSSSVCEPLNMMAGLTRTGSGHPVDAAGLGVAGLVHRSGVVRYSPNLPNLVEFPIGPALARAPGVPVNVGNDATAGTWAAARPGAGPGPVKARTSAA